MRLHSVCPSCNCGDQIEQWLHTALIPAPGSSVSTYDVWSAYLRSHNFQLSLHAYERRYLTRLISWTTVPDGSGVYRVVKGRVHGWVLHPDVERP